MSAPQARPLLALVPLAASVLCTVLLLLLVQLVEVVQHNFQVQWASAAGARLRQGVKAVSQEGSTDAKEAGLTH